MIRQKALEDERIRLASMQNILNKQKEVLAQMRECMAQSQNEQQKTIEQSFNISQIINYNSFSAKLSQDIKLQEQIIQKTTLEINMQQEKVKQAYIKVKSLENLKEKQKEQYNKELMMEEYKLIDDIVNARRTIA